MRSRILAVGAFFSVWLIAAALPALRFSPGDLGSLLSGAALPGVHRVGMWVSALILVALVLSAALLIVFLIRLVPVRRRSKEGEQQIEREKPRLRWQDYAILVLACVTFFAIIRTAWLSSSGSSPHAGAAPASGAQVVPQQPSSIPAAQSAPAEAGPPWWNALIPSWAVFIALGLVLAALGFLLVKKAGRPRADGALRGGAAEPVVPGLPGEEAPLRRPLADEILSCYRDMCALLSDKLEMQDSMTPREFVALLCETGFPVREVRELTGLFERVRYGHEDVGQDERQRARAALEAVRGQVEGAG